MKIKNEWIKIINISALVLLSTGVLVKTVGAAGPSTDVWIDAVRGPSQARISVTVPLAYGFVVNGTTVTTDTSAVTMDNGNLLLPNITIEVLSPSDNQSDYQINIMGESTMRIRNYSTDVLEANLSETDPARVGLGVNLKAFIQIPKNDLGDFLSPAQTYYWKPVAGTPTAAAEDFKKYRVSLDGNAFSQVDAYDSSRINMDGEISLAIPPDLSINGFTAGGTAVVPSVYEVEVGLEVGGYRGQYSQVEKSVKVGKIFWIAEAVDQTTP